MLSTAQRPFARLARLSATQHARGADKLRFERGLGLEVVNSAYDNFSPIVVAKLAVNVGVRQSRADHLPGRPGRVE